ncbi:hypothetical protein BKA80DRAFT_124514 [Phyllosticta citrichinensis]
MAAPVGKLCRAFVVLLMTRARSGRCCCFSCSMMDGWTAGRTRGGALRGLWETGARHVCPSLLLEGQSRVRVGLLPTVTVRMLWCG